MFDPKTIYGKLNIRELIGDKAIRYEVQTRNWPCNEMAYIRLYTEDGRNGWVLVASGCTEEGVAEKIRGVSEMLVREGQRCGGDACGI